MLKNLLGFLKYNVFFWWDLIFLVKFNVCEISFKLHILIHKKRKNNDLLWVTSNRGEREVKHNDEIFYPPKKLILEEKNEIFTKTKKCDLIGQKKSNKKWLTFRRLFLSSQIGHFFQTFFLVDNILVNVHFDAGPSILMFTKKKWRNFINVRFLSQVLRNTNYSCGSTCRQRF